MLQIQSIHTGNLINIKTKLGWMPSFKYHDGDIEIEIPKGLPPLYYLDY